MTSPMRVSHVELHSLLAGLQLPRFCVVIRVRKFLTRDEQCCV